MFRGTIFPTMAAWLLLCDHAPFALGYQHSSPVAEQQTDRLSVRDFITLELRPYTRVRAGSVRIADVAQVVCMNEDLKGMVETLEICEISDFEPISKITARRFRTRLILAGLTLDQIRFRGADACEVECGSPEYVTDKDIELEARKMLCQVMGVSADDLNVQLQTALMQTMSPEIQIKDGLSVQVVPPLKPALGNTSLSVQFWDGNQLLTVRSASFSIRKRFRVAIARASLSREYTLDHSSVDFEERFLSEPVDELTLDQIQGRSLRAVVNAGAVIQIRDLQASRTGKAVAIKKGDLVKVIATNGRLKLQLINVEAMEDGGIGETIELKNRESGKTLAAQVTGPGAAFVRF